MPIEPNTGEWVPTQRGNVPYKVGYMECVDQLAALRAENERLQQVADLHSLCITTDHIDEIERLKAENERLRAVVEAARHVLATRRVSAAGSGWVALEDALAALDEHKKGLA